METSTTEQFQLIVQAYIQKILPNNFYKVTTFTRSQLLQGHFMFLPALTFSMYFNSDISLYASK